MILFKLGVQIPSIKNSSINPRGNAVLLNEEEGRGQTNSKVGGASPGPLEVNLTGTCIGISSQYDRLQCT